jgi:hypothetical protein
VPSFTNVMALSCRGASNHIVRTHLPGVQGIIDAAENKSQATLQRSRLISYDVPRGHIHGVDISCTFLVTIMIRWRSEVEGSTGPCQEISIFDAKIMHSR